MADWGAHTKYTKISKCQKIEIQTKHILLFGDVGMADCRGEGPAHTKYTKIPKYEQQIQTKYSAYSIIGQVPVHRQESFIP